MAAARLDILTLAPAPSVRFRADTTGFRSLTHSVSGSRLAPRGGVISAVMAKCPVSSDCRKECAAVTSYLCEFACVALSQSDRAKRTGELVRSGRSEEHTSELQSREKFV